MKVNVNLLNGGVKYDTPTCELIELDTTATLCQASGNFDVDDLNEGISGWF